MRNFKRKLNVCRMLSIFLIACCAISMSSMYTVNVNAATAAKATDAAIDLATLSAGTELASGTYYLSKTKIFGSVSTMNNGLKIKAGATVYIYVPQGVTLTAIGGGTNAVRRQGGYAGILLPSTSTLIILGDGTVVATGGRAGNGANGSPGGTGDVNTGEDFYYAGYGGAGGAGGGGAGAGIGTNGGYGGAGGAQKNSGGTLTSGKSNYNGNNGNSGSTGGTASACGTLYVQTTITLDADGGAAGSEGSGGIAGGCDQSKTKWDGKQYHVAGGGGGGGGGGAGKSANDIGTGGGAGGGGGSGGSGACDYTTDNNHDGPAKNASGNGAGGTGGTGYYTGTSGSGTRDTGSYDGSWSKTGGSGGLGGSAGANSSAKSVLATGWTNKDFTVTFKTSEANIQQTSYTFGSATTMITVPSYLHEIEDGYRFLGWAISAYGTSPKEEVPLTATDSKVYQPGESIEIGAWLAGNIVLEPVIRAINCKVYFDDNGGSGGQGESLLKPDMTIQPEVTVPTREGYDFLGYYTGVVGGIQYYNVTGEKVYSNPIEENLSKVNLYAQWKIHTSTLTIDANGGTWDGDTSVTKNYKESVTIKDPVNNTEDGRTFLRWVLADEEGELSYNGTLLTGAGYTIFTFGPDTTNVTLKAIWSAPNEARLVLKDGVDQSITSNNLERVFHHVATDEKMGLTAEELVAGTKEIVLTVDTIAVDTEVSSEIPEDVVSIETVLEDSTFKALNYYDISVNKIINGIDVGKLEELPEVVMITIPLTNELANKSGYSVYRVHGGVAEQMSSSRSCEEYYEVGNGVITIYTKKFSTYAITASSSVIGDWTEEELGVDNNNSASTDVQGKYVDASSTRVYKVDVEWGAMKFVFNQHQKWNPDKHDYDDEMSISLDKSAYEGGNNEIVITNHSNADVRVGMNLVNEQLSGINMFLKQGNTNESEAANDLYLSKVSDATGNGVIDSVKAYVRLDEGTLSTESYHYLTESAGEEENQVIAPFQKVAHVVITIEAVKNSETTPLYMGN